MPLDMFQPHSFLFVLSSVVIGFIIGSSNIKRSLLVARDIAIPVGISGSLVDMVGMLSDLSDASNIFSSLSLTLLPTFYGVVLSLLLQPVVHRLQHTSPKQDAHPLTKGRSYAVLLLYFGVSTVMMSTRSEILAFVSPEAFCIVFLIPWLLTRLIPNSDTDRLKQGTLYTLAASFCTILLAGISLLGNAEDPTTFGPAVALAFLGLLYGTVILVLNTIRFHSRVGKSPSFAWQGAAGLMFSFVAGILPINLFLISFSQSTEALSEMSSAAFESKLQNEVLRKMTAQTVPREPSSLTVTSDQPSWVFIDDIYQGPAPLFEFVLDEGEHTVRLTVCANEWAIKDGPGASWESYFGHATSGSCKYADTPEQIEALIASGQATRTVIGEHDGIVQEQLEYSPEYNPCCSSQDTKTFVAAVGGTPLKYVWSFAQGKWLAEPQVSVPEEPAR